MSVRRMDFAGAELVINADGDWRGFRSAACAKEPETAAWIQRVCSAVTVFFDIGACVGSYSLIAASLGATVHAFEPVAANYAQLQTNIWLNAPLPVSAWPVACTSAAAPLVIELASVAPGAASHRVLHDTGSLAARSRTQVAAGIGLDRFVDDYSLPHPTDIKIDVDGGEVAVLEGARRLLLEARSVMVEVNRESEASVTAILHAAGLEHIGSWPRSGGHVNRLFERQGFAGVVPAQGGGER